MDAGFPLRQTRSVCAEIMLKTASWSAMTMKPSQEKLSLVPHDLQRTALEHLQFVAVSIPPDFSKRGWCPFSPRVTP